MQGMDITLKQLLKTTTPYLHKLADAGITTPEEFVYYLPRAYEDRSQIISLREVETDTTASIKGKVINKSMIRTPTWKRLAEIIFEDVHGDRWYISALNGSYLLRQVSKGSRYVFVGKPQLQGGKIQIRHPDIFPAHEQVANTDTSQALVGRIIPIYSEIQGIKSTRFAKKMFAAIPRIIPHMHDALPPDLLERYHLPNLQTTLQNLHFPDTPEAATITKTRLFFERLLHVQLLSLLNKQEYQGEKEQITQEEPHREIVKEVTQKLPFILTTAQKRTITEIIQDLHKPQPMMRLLQGDVGSGKTIVAAISAVYQYKQRWGQTVFLAPLEVLAQQHYAHLAKLLLPMWIRVELLTWSRTAKEKESIKEALQDGRVDVLVGTHAVLQETTKFHNLRLAVIDEQHKFGVKQRAILQQQGSPHLLQMTATPIPRSLALAYFGEFEVSNIDEMPPGRKPITTKIISDTERKKLKPRIITKIQQGQKVFVITPLIEQSDNLDDVMSVKEEYQRMCDLYSELDGAIGLLHGKMKSKEKEETMHKFKTGVYHMLVSTTVIEVGIDIPDATVIVVKNAERFGLSQLHQLRGRVGRSSLQSYCFLQTKRKSGDTYQRLRHMENTTNGFKLAEIDLQLRGAGEILGMRQSWETDIPVDILIDMKFLARVREAAQRLLEKYPHLESLEILNAQLQEKMDNMLV